MAKAELNPWLAPTLADQRQSYTKTSVMCSSAPVAQTEAARHGKDTDASVTPCCNPDLPLCAHLSRNAVPNVPLWSTLSPGCCGCKRSETLWGECLQESNWAETHLLFNAPPWSQSHGRHPSMSLLRPQCSGCRRKYHHAVTRCQFNLIYPKGPF